ncbi:D-alanine--D-alanine ligase [Marinagarivorans cellulosilyticus]|uniref:D-alanine--D-alanine ligase n=1 Tax=Marinagarivorans cellulosilyticus TaxID=2721545 RepID=A0AAN1WHR6_9GAMM|nr:D-alanine--D-alanine ligase [Marinagarivorans cellulosilyticus]BCD97812.1 D-alanine-D-alanine ligase [Marinagarivorans cellulosilyticus]
MTLKQTAFDAKAVAQKIGRIAVLFGGNSAEREISLQSGAAAIEALQSFGVDVVAIDTQENAVAQLQQQELSGAFIALHGVGGEDGKIQGLLEFLNIPYTGSGVLASSLCMDKLRTKQLWSGVNLPSAQYLALEKSTDWVQALAYLGGEAMVKPAHEGSSIGMSRVNTPQALKKAYEEAAQYDTSVLAEQFIVGAEYTVAILNGEALPPIRLQPNSDFYDFNAKYLADDTQYLCPCGLAQAKETELKQLAKAAFTAVGAEGWGRVDIMANAAGEFYLLEVNTVPGLTGHSLVPMAAQAADIDFETLILRIAAQVTAN